MDGEQFKNEKAIIEPTAKADWERNVTIREEFNGDYDSYLAFRVAKEKGFAKIYGEGRA